MRNVLEFINQIYRVYVYPVNYGNINTQIDIDKLRITDIIDTGVELGAEPLCTAAYQGGAALEDVSVFEETTVPDPTTGVVEAPVPNYVPPEIIIPSVTPPEPTPSKSAPNSKSESKSESQRARREGVF